MSYDLAVWEGDRPADDVTAAAEFERLYQRYIGSKEPVEPTARIAAYVTALLARYPDIGTEAGEDSPWSTAPLMGEARGPLVYFPMVWSVCEEVSAWAALLAAEHGLQCFDPQWNRLRPVATDADVARRPSNGLTDADLDVFEDRFARHGWTSTGRRRDGRQTLLDFEREASPAARIVAKLTFDPTSSGVCVYPSIGVRHHTVNDLYSRFLGRLPGGIWTFGRSMADLLPKDGSAPHARWRFLTQRPAAEVARVLADDIDQYGLREVRPLLSLDGLIERLSGVKRHQAWDGLLATTCGIAGRPDQAQAALDAYAAQAAGQNGLMAQQSWRFVRSFVEHFQLEPSRLPFDIPGDQ